MGFIVTKQDSFTGDCSVIWRHVMRPSDIQAVVMYDTVEDAIAYIKNLCNAYELITRIDYTYYTTEDDKGYLHTLEHVWVCTTLMEGFERTNTVWFILPVYERKDIVA